LAHKLQRLKSGYFRGDEPIRLKGLHPDHEEIISALPGKRLRLIHVRLEDARYLELDPILDAVWLFPTFMTGLLIYHASLELGRQALPNVARELVAALEDINAPPLATPEILAWAARGFAPLETGASAPPPPPVKEEPPAPAAADAPAPPAVAPPAVALPAVALAAAGLEPPSLPPIPSPPTAAAEAGAEAQAIVADARSLLEKGLPEMNAKLSEMGLPPFSMEDFEGHLRETQGKIASALQGSREAEAARAKAFGPDGEISPEGFLSLLAGHGVPPADAENILKAATLPMPAPGEFETPELFHEALSLYGEKWAAALNLPAREGENFARQLKTAHLAAAAGDEKSALETVLKGKVPPDKLSGLIQELTAPAEELEGPALVARLGSLGVSEENAQGLAQAMASLAPGPESVKAPESFAQIAAKLRNFNQALAKGLDLPAGDLNASLERTLRAVKKGAWGSAETGEALELLAQRREPLKAFLPALHKIRSGEKLGFNSLAELARDGAGIADPRLLEEIALLDGLNPPLPPAVALAGTPPPADAEGAPEDALKGADAPAEEDPYAFAEEAEEGGVIFTSRQEVEGFIAAHGSKKKDSPEKGAASKRGKGSVFAGLALDGLDFSKLDLAGADFREASLKVAVFRDANLEGAIFAGAKLNGAIFKGANLKGADLTKITGRDLRLVGANLEGADLSDADLKDANLRNLNAPKARFNKAVLPSDFSGGRFAGATFAGNVLKSADFSGVDLSKATFDKCDLNGAYFNKAILDGVTFSGCSLKNASLNEASALRLQTLADSCLDGISAKGSDLSDAVFLSASLRGADFTGASAPNANFTGLDLERSLFEGASLRGAIFYEANITRVNFNGADLMKASLGGAIARAATFRGASLYGANLHKLHVDSLTNFQGADINNTRLAAKEA
jgi:uncharacterized protein YjbI with pentapeptide repeats